jgi:hypothetical protein
VKAPFAGDVQAAAFPVIEIVSSHALSLCDPLLQCEQPAICYHAKRLSDVCGNLDPRFHVHPVRPLPDTLQVCLSSESLRLTQGLALARYAVKEISLSDIQVGDAAIREMGGVTMPLRVTHITSTEIHCGEWLFIRRTRAGIDPDLGWSELTAAALSVLGVLRALRD